MVLHVVFPLEARPYITSCLGSLGTDADLATVTNVMCEGNWTAVVIVVLRLDNFD